MRRVCWIAAVAAPLLISAAEPKILISSALNPNLPTAREGGPDYAGDYSLIYTGLEGRVEACMNLGGDRRCRVVALDVPLMDGQAGSTALEEVGLALESQLGGRRSDPTDGTRPTPATRLEAAVPELVTRLNQALETLPRTMELRTRSDGAGMDVDLEVRDQALRLPGRIEASTGAFSLDSEGMRGQIDPTSRDLGQALYQLPIRISHTDPGSSAASDGPLALTVEGTLVLNVTLQRR